MGNKESMKRYMERGKNKERDLYAILLKHLTELNVAITPNQEYIKREEMPFRMSPESTNVLGIIKFKDGESPAAITDSFGEKYAGFEDLYVGDVNEDCEFEYSALCYPLSFEPIIVQGFHKWFS